MVLTAPDENASNIDDVIHGTDNNDHINSRNGDDIIYGNEGDDILAGDRGDDYLDGGEGNDTLYGSWGSDTIVGGEGNDRVFAGVEDDIILGGAGNDNIRGGMGTDTAVFSGQSSDYTITHNNNRTVTVEDNRDGSPDGTDTLRTTENIQFSDGQYDIETREFHEGVYADGVEYSAEAADNTPEDENLEYRNINDGNEDRNDFVDETLNTGDGDDTITVADDIEDDRVVNTNGGDDSVVVGDDFNSGTINTGDGDDSVVVGDDLGDRRETATINTDSGDDSVTINGNMLDESAVNSGDGDDTINVNGSVADETAINSGAGDDTLNIHRISDDATINSGSGDDVVTIDDVSGGYDDGSVTLGDGNDRLVINDSLHGVDTVFDGGDGLDGLVLSNVDENHWNSGVSDQFVNFESVTLSDTNIDLTAGETFENITSSSEIDGSSNNDSFVVDSSVIEEVQGDNTNNSNDTSGNSGFGGMFGGGHHGGGMFGNMFGDSSSDTDDNDDSLSLDGGDGLDTLVVNGDVDLDLNELSDNLSNMETIDLNSGSQNVTSIGVNDVLEVTDSNNILRIDGDSSDSVSVDTEDEGAQWQLGGFTTEAETGNSYQTFTPTDEDVTVTLEINTDIQIDQS